MAVIDTLVALVPCPAVTECHHLQLGLASCFTLAVRPSHRQVQASGHHSILASRVIDYDSHD